MKSNTFCKRKGCKRCTEPLQVHEIIQPKRRKQNMYYLRKKWPELKHIPRFKQQRNLKTKLGTNQSILRLNQSIQIQAESVSRSRDTTLSSIQIRSEKA